MVGQAKRLECWMAVALGIVVALETSEGKYVGSNRMWMIFEIVTDCTA